MTVAVGLAWAGLVLAVAWRVRPVVPSRVARLRPAPDRPPRDRPRPRRRRRRGALAPAVPDAVDLLVVAVQAGLTIPLALGAVARRTDGPLGEGLTAVVAEVARGRRTADALDDLPARLGREGEAVRPLVATLVSAERYGAPLAATLERMADDARRQRRRRAEEAARRLPVKLLFPLVCCTLPAFGLLTVAPLVASAVRSLRL